MNFEVELRLSSRAGRTVELSRKYKVPDGREMQKLLSINEKRDIQIIGKYYFLAREF